MLKQQKGITLVALVITIVVLIILAGVAISLTLSDNGLFTKARKGATNYDAAKKIEEEERSNVEGYIDGEEWKTE